MALMQKQLDRRAGEHHRLEQMIDGYLPKAKARKVQNGRIPDLLRQIISQYERTASGRIHLTRQTVRYPAGYAPASDASRARQSDR